MISSTHIKWFITPLSLALLFWPLWVRARAHARAHTHTHTHNAYMHTHTHAHIHMHKKNILKRLRERIEKLVKKTKIKNTEERSGKVRGRREMIRREENGDCLE